MPDFKHWDEKKIDAIPETKDSNISSGD